MTVIAVEVVVVEEDVEVEATETWEADLGAVVEEVVEEVAVCLVTEGLEMTTTTSTTFCLPTIVADMVVEEVDEMGTRDEGIAMATTKGTMTMVMAMVVTMRDIMMTATATILHIEVGTEEAEDAEEAVVEAVAAGVADEVKEAKTKKVQKALMAPKTRVSPRRMEKVVNLLVTLPVIHHRWSKHPTVDVVGMDSVEEEDAAEAVGGDVVAHSPVELKLSA